MLKVKEGLTLTCQVVLFHVSIIFISGIKFYLPSVSFGVSAFFHLFTPIDFMYLKSIGSLYVSIFVFPLGLLLKILYGNF